MQNPLSSTVADSSDKRGDSEVETTRGEDNSHTEERSIASEGNNYHYLTTLLHVVLVREL